MFRLWRSGPALAVCSVLALTGPARIQKEGVQR
jgi:hypothetical protein